MLIDNKYNNNIEITFNDLLNTYKVPDDFPILNYIKIK